jgi:transposase
MAYSYKPVDRSQPFLLPPDVREWLPEGHLVWLVLDVVKRLDTSVLHARHRRDGVGRQAYDPDMLLALLIYAYCTGVRSSRAIERLCQVDVAYRVVCANLVADHSTIARFRQGHQRVAQSLFVEVLAICAQAGLVRVGVVAVDGTKVGADAALRANRTRAQIEAEVAAMFAQAAEVDAGEDRLFGDARGDELPAELADPRRRGARLDAAVRVLEAQEAARRAEAEAARAARANTEAEAAARGERPPGRPRFDEEVVRAEAAVAELEAELADPSSELSRVDADLAAAEAAAAAVDAAKVTPAGKKIGRPRKSPGGQTVRRIASRRDRAVAVAERRRRHAQARLAKARARAALRAAQRADQPEPTLEVNVTDPDSRIMKTASGWVQGYNAQAAVNDLGVILAAQVTQDHNDMHQCIPMMAATQANLAAAGVAEPVGTMVFDAGYCSQNNLTAPGPDRLIATTKSWKLRRAARQDGWATGDPPADATPIEAMEHRLRTEAGAAVYGLRQHTVEPVFGQTKFNRGYDRFMRRGRHAADAEWQLIATAHNLLKLFTATGVTLPAS